MFWEAPVAHLRSRLLQILLPALLSAGLIFTTALNYPLLTLGLVTVSVAMFWAALWSAAVLLGHRSARVLAVLALGLGWFAEQMGSSRGWFFGRYTYTEVLGPRLGDVPMAIPLMWFALCLVGYVMACLMLWRAPVHPGPSFRSGLLTAWLAAMVVTALAAVVLRARTAFLFALAQVAINLAMNWLLPLSFGCFTLQFRISKRHPFTNKCTLK